MCLRKIACLVFFTVFIPGLVLADTVIMADGTEVKGLVVEEHHDRVVLSTIDGEMTILRSDFKEINFDDPAYSLLSLGREMERQKKYGQALSYYEKAFELNQDLKEAKEAALGIRGKFWSDIATGPRGEVSKQQDFENAYRANTDVETQAARNKSSLTQRLWQGLGIKIKKYGDYYRVVKVQIGSHARKRGMRPGDVLITIDGKSLRHLNEESVGALMAEPQFSSMTLTVLRTIRFSKNLKDRKPKYLGFSLEQDYNGIIFEKVKDDSLAYKYTIREGDLLRKVDGLDMRYMSLKDATRLMEKSKTRRFELSIEKKLQMTRK